MSKDIIINGETYSGVSEVELPVSGGTAVFRDVDEIPEAPGASGAGWALLTTINVESPANVIEIPWREEWNDRGAFYIEVDGLTISAADFTGLGFNSYGGTPKRYIGGTGKPTSISGLFTIGNNIGNTFYLMPTGNVSEMTPVAEGALSTLYIWCYNNATNIIGGTVKLYGA